MKLNLGSCDRAFLGYTSVDLCPPAEIIADLAAPWPWESSSIEALRAYDIIEHIGDCQHQGNHWCDICAASRGAMPFGQKRRHWRGPIHVMNEAWRVLQPGGVLDIEVPTTDGRGAWQDPTHVSFWNRNSFLYYTDGDAHRERFGKHYGVDARFRVLAEAYVKFPADDVVKLKISLGAVKLYDKAAL